MIPNPERRCPRSTIGTRCRPRSFITDQTSCNKSLGAQEKALRVMIVSTLSMQEAPAASSDLPDDVGLRQNADHLSGVSALETERRR